MPASEDQRVHSFMSLSRVTDQTNPYYHMQTWGRLPPGVVMPGQWLGFGYLFPPAMPQYVVYAVMPPPAHPQQVGSQYLEEPSQWQSAAQDPYTWLCAYMIVFILRYNCNDRSTWNVVLYSAWLRRRHSCTSGGAVPQYRRK